MKKIPSIFERDWDGNKDLVSRTPNPQAQWVFDGEGTAMRKIDGTCCLIENGKLWKRREIKKGKSIPDDFVLCEEDPITNKIMGWVPVSTDAPEDRWHNEAMRNAAIVISKNGGDGTYELIGPSIQGNPERVDHHMLISHKSLEIDQPPRDYDGLRAWLDGRDIEGIVWHHPDGRMAKIKLKDFGLKRPSADGITTV